MSSTNKTTNYDLSQYIGSDKPTYLSDYNGDMFKIDAQMKVNADNVATAISSASTATSTANNAVSTANSASSDASTALSTANSASTTASNAQSTANSALSTATSAQTTANTANSKADTITSRLNLSSITTYGTSDVSVTAGTLSSCSLTVATNADGSLFKFYGEISGTGLDKVILQTSLRPTSEYTINPAGIDSEGWGRFITVKTDGKIECYMGFGATTRRALYFPALYWNSNFSDEPTQNE